MLRFVGFSRKSIVGNVFGNGSKLNSNNNLSKSTSRSLIHNGKLLFNQQQHQHQSQNQNKDNVNKQNSNPNQQNNKTASSTTNNNQNNNNNQNKTIENVKQQLQKQKIVKQMPNGYNLMEKGAEFRQDFWRGFLTEGEDAKPLSFWHDIPFWKSESEGIANMVVLTPRNNMSFIRIAQHEVLNPLVQEIHNGQIRIMGEITNIHYGVFPQSWSNPSLEFRDLGFPGDNMPLDVIDISIGPSTTGEVRAVKVLGCYCQIDQRKADFKVIVINAEDPQATYINDIYDIEEHYPGRLRAAYVFLRDLYVPFGSPPGRFGWFSKLQNKKFTMGILNQAHLEWKKLIAGQTLGQNFSLIHTVPKGIWNPFEFTNEAATEQIEIASSRLDAMITERKRRDEKFDKLLDIYAEREWVREGKMRYFRDTEGQKAEFDRYANVVNERREKRWREEHEKKTTPPTTQQETTSENSTDPKQTPPPPTPPQ